MSISEKNNIETIWQIWLLNSINDSQKITVNLEQTRSSNNNSKVFDNILECEQFIRSISNDNRIVFIVDDLLGRKIIPQIHDLQQIFAIYVYSIDKQSTESYFKEFSKV